MLQMMAKLEEKYFYSLQNILAQTYKQLVWWTDVSMKVKVWVRERGWLKLTSSISN